MVVLKKGFSKVGVNFAFVFLSLSYGSLTFAADDDPIVFGYGHPLLLFDLDLAIGYDSNLYNVEDDVQDSFYLQPDLKIGTIFGSEVLNGQIGYQYKLFEPKSKSDKAESNIVNMEANWSPVTQQSLGLTITSGSVDEKRGSGLTSGDPFAVAALDSYDFDLTELNYKYGYPSQRSILFELAYGLANRVYSSERSEALVANFEQYSFSTNIGYRWGAERRLYVGAKHIELEYPDVSSGVQNSVNQISFLGLGWQIASTMDYAIAIGQEHKTLDVSGKEYETDYWNAALNWSPLYHTNFVLKGGNEQQPLTKQNQTLYEVRDVTIGWQHIWNTEFQTYLSLSKETTRSIVSDVVELEEGTILSLSANYHDFELSVNFESDRDTADSSQYSQYYIVLAYNLKGGF